MVDWKKYFDYDADTGDLIHRARPEESFKTLKAAKEWNNKYPGTVAGWKKSCKGKPHSVCVNVFGSTKAAHIVIYEMHFGVVPPGKVVDHWDKNPFNNRLHNLRPATKSQNGMNSDARANGSTGYKGVCLDRRAERRGHKKYLATITKDGKQRHLGHYETPELAHAAYCDAAKELHGEFART
jgi:hypothetical protein